MPQTPLSVDSTVPSGPVPPGTNFSFFLHRGGNKDDVPDTGFQWEVFHNGKSLSGAALTRLSIAQVGHTFNRPRIGFQLKPDVTGLIEVRGSGHGLDQRWAYPIKKGTAPVGKDAPVTKADLDALADRIVNEVKGLMSSLVK